jgi:hypothetical protein
MIRAPDAFPRKPIGTYLPLLWADDGQAGSDSRRPDRAIVGSEVAHQGSPMLATVRRSNRACRFPAHGFPAAFPDPFGRRLPGSVAFATLHR